MNTYFIKWVASSFLDLWAEISYGNKKQKIIKKIHDSFKSLVKPCQSLLSSLKSGKTAVFFNQTIEF